MRLILTFFVVSLTLVLILGVLVAIFVGMIALWSVRRAWLNFLVAMIRRSLVLLFLLTLVVVVTMTTVIAILPLVVVMMIRVALPVCECLTAACKAFSLANVKGTGTNDWLIKSLDD